MLLASNNVIDSRYKLHEKLGEGGFAVVFRAEDLELGRTVAIKFLKEHLKDDCIQRFVREAKLIGKSKHPNVVSIYSINFLKDENLPYLVMEYLEGESLASLVSKTGALPEKLVLKLCIELCSGLGYLHENNILHRDLSPANIFILNQASKELEIKIIDFGLSKAETDSRLTATGILLGNPSYMSPEQARGCPLDHRSDIYSLACVFYTAIFGKPPFEADNSVALLYKHQKEQPIFPKLDWNDTRSAKNVIEALQIAMNKEAEHRFQSCSVFASALTGELVQKKKNPFRSRKRVLAGTVSVLALLPLSITVFSNLKSGTSEPQPQKLPRKVKGTKSSEQPGDFFSMLDLADNYIRSGAAREALGLLSSLELKTKTFERKQVIQMRKLQCYGILRMQNEEIECAEKLFTEWFSEDNSIVTISLIDYYMRKNPDRCVSMVDHWHKRNGEEGLALDLKKLRALTMLRKFDQAKTLIARIDNFCVNHIPISRSDSVDLEELRLVVESGNGKKFDLACTIDAIPGFLSSQRCAAYSEVAELLESAGQNIQAIKLWQLAAEREKRDPQKKLGYLLHIFNNDDNTKRFPDEVISACNEALKLDLGINMSVTVRNSMAWSFFYSKKPESSLAVARENYQRVLSVISTKKEQTEEARDTLLTSYSTLASLLRAYGRREEYEQIRKKTLLLLDCCTVDAAAIRASILLDDAQDSINNHDENKAAQLIDSAASQLIASKWKVPRWLLHRPITQIDSITSEIPQSLEKIRKAQAQSYPTKSQPVDLLALLAKSYKTTSKKSELESLYKDTVSAIKLFSMETAEGQSASLITLSRIYSGTACAIDLEALLNQKIRTSFGATKVILSLALLELHSDKMQGYNLRSELSEIKRQLRELTGIDDNVTAELRRCSMIVVLRVPASASKEFIEDLLSNLKIENRLKLYVEIASYFEEFSDYGIFADFLKVRMYELENLPFSELMQTLYCVKGDCCFRSGRFKEAEDAYKMVLKHDSSSNQYRIDLAEMQVAQGKHFEALENFRKVKTIELRSMNAAGTSRLISDWMKAAERSGSSKDIQAIEDFKRMKDSWQSKVAKMQKE